MYVSILQVISGFSGTRSTITIFPNFTQINWHVMYDREQDLISPTICCTLGAHWTLYGTCLIIMIFKILYIINSTDGTIIFTTSTNIFIYGMFTCRIWNNNDIFFNRMNLNSYSLVFYFLLFNIYHCVGAMWLFVLIFKKYSCVCNCVRN